MGYENSAGIDVSNHYGPRVTGQTGGVIKTEGGKNQLSIQFGGEDMGSPQYQEAYIPAGSLVTNAWLRVEEVFAVTGGSANIGTEGSESTNGVSASKAQMEAVGFYDIMGTPSGTWAAMLVDDTVVGIDGTATGGSAEVIIEYIKIEV